MSKNIILCSDGTGNKGIKDRGTNVFKLFESIDLHNSRQKQIVFYDDGVGTSKIKPITILGGAFGLGLSRNVRQLYTDLVRCYKPGDKIFLFGFSRGAYTVRVLAGFIDAVGILDIKNAQGDAELQRTVRTAYRLYRKKYRALLSEILYYSLGWIPRLFYRLLRVRCLASSADDFRKQFSVKPGKGAIKGRVPIEYIGVWDTVSAVGLPIYELTWLLDKAIYKFEFRDRTLSQSVKKGCHAISVDDERKTFQPMLWDEHNEKNNRVEQVWFSGVHSNVGGGYPRQGMSLVAMQWMMNQAYRSGLRFTKPDQDFYASHGNVHDKLHDSRAGLAVYYRFKPRDIHAMCDDKGVAPKIHESVLDRIIAMSAGYAPGNIPGNVRFAPVLTPSPRLKRAEKEIKKALGQHSSALDRVRHWIMVRKWAHFILLVFTGIAVYYTFYADGTVEGIAMSIQDAFSERGMIEKGWDLFKTRPWVVLVIAAMYGLSRFLRWRMHLNYSRFWYPLVPRL
jgi:uncharacterized protein (DUF2235 family)